MIPLGLIWYDSNAAANLNAGKPCNLSDRTAKNKVVGDQKGLVDVSVGRTSGRRGQAEISRNSQL